MLSFLLHNFLDVEELSHATWMFNFIRNCQTVLQSYCSLLHAQQCMRVSGPLYQHLWPLLFFFLGILIRSGIIFHSLMKMILGILSWISFFLSICLWWNAFQTFYSFFIGFYTYFILSFEGILYILDLRTLSDE